MSASTSPRSECPGPARSSQRGSRTGTAAVRRLSGIAIRGAVHAGSLPRAAGRGARSLGRAGKGLSGVGAFLVGGV